MGILRVQHALQDVTGLPEDQYVNTFYFITEAASVTLPESNAGAFLVNGFYQASMPSPPISWFSKQCTGEWVIKTYDMADPLPRTPIESYAGTYTGVGSGSGSGLPSEVAACLSYRAAPAAGIPASRLRGRIYLGPLDLETMFGSSTQTSRVDQGFMGTCLDAAVAMNAASAVVDLVWAIYSPTRNAASPIVHLWMDDAWDIQRRRGAQATARLTRDI